MKKTTKTSGLAVKTALKGGVIASNHHRVLLGGASAATD
jgi:hypothetical protein